MKAKLFLTSVIALFVSSSLSAQNYDFDEPEKANTIFFYGGPQASLSTGTGLDYGMKLSYLAGVQYERSGLMEDVDLFAGLEYTSKGVKDMRMLTISGDYRNDSYTLNYIQMNVGAKYSTALFGIRGFGQMGPYVSYGIGGNTSLDGKEMEKGSFGEIDTDGELVYYRGGAGFKKIDVGLNIAVGVEFSNVRIMAGYQLGLINIADQAIFPSYGGVIGGYKNQGVYLKLGYALKL